MFKKLAVGALALVISSLPLSGIAHAATVATNLIPNPSFETSASGTTPDSWQTSSYNLGTGTAAFTYLNTGHTGSHSAEIQINNYVSGDANWYYADVPVTAGTTYQFQDWYQSDVNTEIDAEVVVNGIAQYVIVGTAFANTAWTQFSGTFTAPAGATSMSLYHLIAHTGYLITDDSSLAAYTPTPFTRGIVSVSFDDGWVNQLQNAEPVLLANHIPATYNIIAGEMTTPDEAGYMTSAQVKGLYTDGNGNEIASHTVHHCDLTGVQTDNPANCPIPISTAQINSELQDSQTILQNLIGAPVTDFAYPYGSYNAATIANAKQYYTSQRSVISGYNTKDNLDPTQLKIYEVDSNITTAQVQAWIDGAIQNKAWLILVYHEVAITPSDPTDATYDTQPSDFATEMAYLKGTNVATETVSQALKEVQSQATGVAKAGDINGDGVVDALDLSTLLSNWNKTGATAAQGDLNADGTVDALDLSTLLANWSI